jgi:hypothetical protein
VTASHMPPAFLRHQQRWSQRVYELGLDLSDSGSTITLENLLSGIVMAALPLFYSDSITLAYR